MCEEDFTNLLGTARPHQVGNAGPSGGGPKRWVSDVADQLPELVDVLETAVHRGEAHVGNLVYPLELAHDEFAQTRGRHFFRAAIEQLLLDALHGGVDLLDADRPLAQRQ